DELARPADSATDVTPARCAKASGSRKRAARNRPREAMKRPRPRSLRSSTIRLRWSTLQLRCATHRSTVLDPPMEPVAASISRRAGAARDACEARLGDAQRDLGGAGPSFDTVGAPPRLAGERHVDLTK